MSASKAMSKKRIEVETAVLGSKLDGRKRIKEDDVDLDISNDIQGIMSALQQIREKAEKDGQKKNEETISSVASEIRSTMNEFKSKLEKDREVFLKSLSKSSKECEGSLKNEIAKFQAIYNRFCKDKIAHLQALDDTVSKFEETKDRLYVRYEQMRKREKAVIAEHERACADKIAKLEESLKKKNQGNKTFSILRKTLGSFLENASDEDFPLEE
ncbi:hypothetical protein SAY87_002541 [Trapa incisa]|uniref:DNA ligase 1 n=2 Tax=Trapa TaxID=22665 RepID=A0AAN7QER5_TRANT|nr:hypothetical protein SAY87_002541 [Trapa incisa]KAK4765557.1 hypothetical protein SAY86_026647 [Trapa natans]